MRALGMPVRGAWFGTMNVHDGLSSVELFHHGIEQFVPEILTIVLSEDTDSVEIKVVQGISNLPQ